MENLSHLKLLKILVLHFKTKLGNNFISVDLTGVENTLKELSYLEDFCIDLYAISINPSSIKELYSGMRFLKNLKKLEYSAIHSNSDHQSISDKLKEA